MKPGDLLINVFQENYGYGILLQIEIDKNLIKNIFSVPWKYTVLWSNGTVSNHEIGSLRRIQIYNSLYY